MKKIKYLRFIVALSLLIVTFFGFILIGAGSHGNISMENTETAFIFYSAIAFLLTVVINTVLIYQPLFSKGILPIIFNGISSVILAFHLIYSIQFNFNGGNVPILLLLFNLLILLILGFTICEDFKMIKSINK